MADGAGGGAVSGTTLRVGSGNAGAFRLLFSFVLLFAFASQCCRTRDPQSASGDSATRIRTHIHIRRRRDRAS